MRKSNFELLRIIAILLVMLVHSNFYSINIPTQNEIFNSSIISYCRLFVQGLSISCVNIFILISGYFGIKPCLRSFSKFIFSCIFITISVYLFCIVLNKDTVSLSRILDVTFLSKEFWFIKSYILLYILSPVINSFVNTIPKKQNEILIASLTLYMVVFSWIFDSTEYLEGGASPLFFIYLYILGRYLNIYNVNFFKQRSIYLILYIFISLILAYISFISLKYYPQFGCFRMFRYDNPLVVCQAMLLLLFFKNLTFKSKLVNYIASSSLAIYLFHTHPSVMGPFFCNPIKYAFQNYNYPLFLLIVLLIIIVFVIIAVIIDKSGNIIYNYVINNIDIKNGIKKKCCL